MLDTKVVVVPEFVTAEDYAVDIFAKSGRTVRVTRSGDAPIVPLEELDPVRDTFFVTKVADEEEIEKLKKIKEMRERFQILESVPYTDIIISHEIPERVIDARQAEERERSRPKRPTDGSVTPGQVLGVVAAIAVGLVSVVGIIGFFAISLGVLAVLVMLGGMCGRDPIVYARLEDGSWLEIARWYE
jgi:hypothetical protein